VPTEAASAQSRIAVRIDGYAPIGDYAAIGDGRTLALVALDGSIDWLPLPTLTGDAAFHALLDSANGGRCSLAVEGAVGISRRYVEGTNVLETTFETETGTVRITDALNLQDGGIVPWVELARRVECVDGSAAVAWRVEPRPGFGAEPTELREVSGHTVAVGASLNLGVLTWGLGTPYRSTDMVSGGTRLEQGDTALLVCVATEDEPIPMPTREEVETRLAGTCDAWARWLHGQRYEGAWLDAVERSALALKLLTYAPTGAMTAAGTTALPERIGGPRNYDYRFAWIRDMSLTLDVLTRLGFREQVHASLAWLLDATEPTHPRLQPFYTVEGSVPREMEELPLPGYRGSQPVQRGNSAATQLQLGNFGDLFQTVTLYVERGNVLDRGTARRLAETAGFLCEIWQNEDAGLWELSKERHYTSSKINCWVALTRAAALAEDGHIPNGDAVRWLEEAEAVREFVETRCWSAAKRSYSFYADTDELDCATLLASILGFADPAGERMSSTIEALTAELGVGDALLYRYSGMRGKEGCFLACSFWMITALAKAGRLDEARARMEAMLAVANDVGLLSEEIDPATHELLGNFPQALTHLALIQAAHTVTDAERSEENG
jgi:GH15 family glucan-1,4-alpha-glucosidase